MSHKIDHRFNLLDGKVTFNGLSVVEDDPIGISRIDLTEDLMQVSYPNNVVMDLGWYGESFEGENGCFFVYLIKNADWGKPLIRIPCQTVLKAIEIMNIIAANISVFDDEIEKFININELYFPPC